MDVPDHSEPAVAFSFHFPDFNDITLGTGFFLEAGRLVEGDEGVGGSVEYEDWRESGFYIVEGGHGFADRSPFDGVAVFHAEGRAEAFGGTAIAKVLGGISHVNEIGYGIKYGDGLNLTALAKEGIFGFGIARIAGGGYHKAEVTSGTAAGYGDFVFVYAVFVSVESNEAGGEFDVFYDFGNSGFGLRNVVDTEYGVAAMEERSDHPRSERGGSGLPAAADHDEEGFAVGFVGGNDVEEELLVVAGSILHAVLYGARRTVVFSEAEGEEHCYDG